jgi:multicomponent Na+:H+ antiporter subunit A
LGILLDWLLDPTALLLVTSLLAAPVAALAGALRPGLAVSAGIAMAAIAFAAALLGSMAGGTTIDLPWASTWGLRLMFALDGLAVLYALLSTGIGLSILVYASRYIPLHLAHQGRPAADIVPFVAFVLLFMGAMVGLVMAQDLLLIFLFWDLTAIASYFLIGYDRQEEASRTAALMAFLVTGISAVLFLVGAILIATAYGTFALPELVARAEAGLLLTVATGLMAIAGLAKSAQAPLHFWLPRAMAAPTPVSAYLHSAAMVAAGVFLLARLHPLIAHSDLLLDALLVIGFLSMGVGGVLALAQDELKPVLAYSTVAQYGYVVVMLGLGGTYGLAGAAFYVLAHALAKSALFLTAGTVIEATGEKSLARLGGLWRTMPMLALGSGVAAAALAALPLTIGFFKDELFFAAALARGPVVTALAVAGAAMTLAYVGRFWGNIFLGTRRVDVLAQPAALVLPVLVLGFIAVLGGLVVGPAEHLAQAAGAVTFGAPTPISLVYHLDARPENLLALATYALGGLLLVTRAGWRSVVTSVARLGERLGPERAYRVALGRLNAFSDAIHRVEVRDLRSRVAAVLVPGGALVVAGVLATPNQGAFAVGAVGRDHLPLVLVLSLAVAAALATTVPRDHLLLALILSGVGFSLAVVYAFLGAPDVALVAVLIETLFALLVLGVLAALPRSVLRRATEDLGPPSRRLRDPALALVAGLVAFVVVWGVLSKPASLESAAAQQTELTPAAHARDVVTAILADFRGFDTLGEMTVVGVALLGLATLLTRGRLR